MSTTAKNESDTVQSKPSGGAAGRELPGGLKSLRVPVVVAGSKKNKKSRGKPAADPHQVERAPKPKFKPTECWGHNDRVYLTGLDLNTHMPASDFADFVGSLVETADPLDRAHKRRRLIDPSMPRHLGESYVLLNHHELAHLIRRSSKKPKITRRRYHPSQLTSRGVAFDSMYDNAFAVAEAMHKQGVNLGWGVRKSGDYSAAEQDRAHVLAGLGAREARAVFTQRTSHAMSQSEQELEKKANALLGVKKADYDPI